MLYIAIITLLFCSVLVTCRIDKLLRKNSHSELIAKNSEVGEKEYKAVRNPEKPVSKNDSLNHEKAALRARRQGHLRFMYHGQYYFTGLKVIDNGNIQSY